MVGMRFGMSFDSIPTEWTELASRFTLLVLLYVINVRSVSPAFAILMILFQSTVPPTWTLQQLILPDVSASSYSSFCTEPPR
eukprot:6458052-Amphidinium_carterae.1